MMAKHRRHGRGSSLNKNAQDPFGPMTVTTAASASLVAAVGYDEYGVAALPAGTPDVAVGFGYRGQLAVDGIPLMRDRAYDPATGRFTATDPQGPVPGMAATTTPYPYANNDPLNLIDPTGASSQSDTSFALVARWASSAGDWIYANRGTIATVLATGGCFIPAVGQVACGALQAGAFGVRTQQTLSEGGGLTGQTITAVGVDLALTGTGLAAGAAIVNSLARTAELQAFAATSRLHGPASAVPLAVAGAARAETSVAGKLANAACFTAGTPVLLADGTSKPIEQITAGDKVTAFNPDTGETETRNVVRTFVHREVPTYDVMLVGGEKVTTTSAHPFWVEGRGWTAVADLRSGDRLRQPDGSTVAVQFVSGTGQTATVYNFEVDELHDYCVQVGSHWVLVHNTCDLDAEGLEHVMARHTAGGIERDATAGVFDNRVDLAGLARGSAGQVGTRSAATGNIEYVVTARGIVGVTGTNRLPTSTYTIVRNSYGELVTMFPGR